MWSVINFADPSGIKQIVEQQFNLGRRIMRKRLVPILDPEVNIKSPDKAECEAMLRAELIENVSSVVVRKVTVSLLRPLEDIDFTLTHARFLSYPSQLKTLCGDEKLMFKLTLPDVDDLYENLVTHPNVVHVVALSGGYTRAEADAMLARQHGVVASFSRTLTEGLRDNLTQEAFDAALDGSIGDIFDASKACGIVKQLHPHQ